MSKFVGYKTTKKLNKFYFIGIYLIPQIKVPKSNGMPECPAKVDIKPGPPFKKTLNKANEI